MRLHVDPQSAVPVYEQIRSQLATMIRSGVLEAGSRLPTIRQLALDLGIAKATVNKAYEQLFTEDLVEAQGAKGTVVKQQDQRQSERHVRDELEKAAEAFVVAALFLQVDEETAHRSIDRAYEKVREAL